MAAFTDNTRKEIMVFFSIRCSKLDCLSYITNRSISEMKNARGTCTHRLVAGTRDRVQAKAEKNEQFLFEFPLKNLIYLVSGWLYSECIKVAEHIANADTSIFISIFIHFFVLFCSLK